MILTFFVVQVRQSYVGTDIVSNYQNAAKVSFIIKKIQSDSTFPTKDLGVKGFLPDEIDDDVICYLYWPRIKVCYYGYSSIFLVYRVILRNPYVGKNVMTRSQYKQMIGRAGRAGIDTSGESIIIVDKRDKDKVMSYLI